MKLALTAALLCFGIAPLAAQVGSEPDKSPYQDFTYHAGILRSSAAISAGDTGEADVGPKSGADRRGAIRASRWRARGAERAARPRSARMRNVLDPTKTGDGAKSRHGVGSDLDRRFRREPRAHRAEELSPLRSDLRPSGSASRGAAPRPMSGGYSFGTGFAIHFGGALKFVTHGPWGARLDVSDYIWQLGYPGAYFLAPTGGTSILAQDQAQNQWTHNPVITFGISYIFAR